MTYKKYKLYTHQKKPFTRRNHQIKLILNNILLKMKKSKVKDNKKNQIINQKMKDTQKILKIPFQQETKQITFSLQIT